MIPTFSLQIKTQQLLKRWRSSVIHVLVNMHLVLLHQQSHFRYLWLMWYTFLLQSVCWTFSMSRFLRICSFFLVFLSNMCICMCQIIKLSSTLSWPLITIFPQASSLIMHVSWLLQKDNGDEELCSVFVPTNHLYIGDIFLVSSKEIIRPNLSIREGIGMVFLIAMATFNLFLLITLSVLSKECLFTVKTVFYLFLLLTYVLDKNHLCKRYPFLRLKYSILSV